MMSITEYFLANIGTSIVLTIIAFFLAVLFVLILERYFNVTLKDPKIKFDIKDPVGKVPKIKDPVGKF